MVEKDYSLCGRTIPCVEGLFLVEKDHCGGGKWKMENIGKWKIWKKVNILPQACRRRFFFLENDIFLEKRAPSYLSVAAGAF